jgi:hypothetical protein
MCLPGPQARQRLPVNNKQSIKYERVIVKYGKRFSF